MGIKQKKKLFERGGNLVEKAVTTLTRDETATCVEAKCRYAAAST